MGLNNPSPNLTLDLVTYSLKCACTDEVKVCQRSKFLSSVFSQYAHHTFLWQTSTLTEVSISVFDVLKWGVCNSTCWICSAKHRLNTIARALSHWLPVILNLLHKDKGGSYSIQPAIFAWLCAGPA